MEREKVISAAIELNELLFKGADEQIPIEGKTIVIVSKIKEASELLEPEDELTENTLKTLHLLKVDVSGQSVKEEVKEPEIKEEMEEEIPTAEIYETGEEVEEVEEKEIKKEVKKEVSKKVKKSTSKKEVKKAVKKYTRVQSVCDVFKKNKNINDMDKLAQLADSLYIENNSKGASNLKESKWFVRYAISILKEFETPII